MKTILTIIVLFIFFPAFIGAYEVGGKAKSNFNSQSPVQADVQEKEKEQAPATRSFTSYSSRQNWTKGVQTQKVQTQVAGTNVTDFKSTPTPVPGGKANVDRAVQSATPVESAAVPTQASTQTAAGAAGTAQMAAVMQQLQGVQNMVKTMGAAAQTATGAQQPAGAAAASGTTPPAGMPDFSALLNPAGAPATFGGKAK